MAKSSNRSHVTPWLIPLLYVVGALVAGLTIPRVESRLFPNLFSPMSISVAISIYSSIASGMIALTGIVFSLTFVMAQFSATTFSPRLVLWISRDPVIAHSIGVFSATFLYAVTALAGVDRGGSGKVPLVSVYVELALLLGSVGMFVALIQRVGLLQINRMLVFTGDRGREVIEALSRTLEPGTQAAAEDFVRLPVTQTVFHKGAPRAVQSLDIASLIAAAREADGVIEMKAAVGDTLVERTPVLVLRGARASLNEPRLWESIELGTERTFDQDPKYALRLLVDIAIRALSPAINDPTTAVQALDQIEDLLLRLGERHLEAGQCRDREGKLRVVVTLPKWEDYLLLALDEIRLCGASSVQVMRRMKAMVNDLAAALPEARRDALRCWDARIDSTIASAFADPQDKRDALVEDRQGLGVPRQPRAEPKR